MKVTTLNRLNRDSEARKKSIETYTVLVLRDVPDYVISAHGLRKLRPDDEGYIFTVLIDGVHYSFSFLRGDDARPGHISAALGVIATFPPGAISMIPARRSSLPLDPNLARINGKKFVSECFYHSRGMVPAVLQSGPENAGPERHVFYLMKPHCSPPVDAGSKLKIIDFSNLPGETARIISDVEREYTAKVAADLERSEAESDASYHFKAYHYSFRKYVNKRVDEIREKFSKLPPIDDAFMSWLELKCKMNSL